jgi:hypothetical protein
MRRELYILVLLIISILVLSGCAQLKKITGFAVAGYGHGAAGVTGQVTTNPPVEGAQVVASQGGIVIAGTITDQDGYYILILSSGTYNITTATTLQDCLEYQTQINVVVTTGLTIVDFHLDPLDDDNDGVTDCIADQCLGTPAEAIVNADGCTAYQLKDKAVDNYQDLSADLLQEGSEIGSGEVLDVLFLLVNAREGIVQDNFLFMTKPPQEIVGDKTITVEKDSGAGESLVYVKVGGYDTDFTVYSVDDAVIIQAIVDRPESELDALNDAGLVADLMEVGDITVLEGSDVFEYQHTVYEKLNGFEGKKINGQEIRYIPSILSDIEVLQVILVDDSRILADILLDNIDCSSLSGSAHTECDLGESFLADGDNIGLPGPERMDYYKKAWLQGVKVLDELGVTGDVARRS